jgi:hypothetical protein
MFILAAPAGLKSDARESIPRQLPSRFEVDRRRRTALLTNFQSLRYELALRCCAMGVNNGDPSGTPDFRMRATASRSLTSI